MSIIIEQVNFRQHIKLTIDNSIEHTGVIVHSGTNMPFVIEDTSGNYHIQTEPGSSNYQVHSSTDLTLNGRGSTNQVQAILLPGDVLDILFTPATPPVVIINGTVVEEFDFLLSYVKRCRGKGGIDHDIVDKMLSITKANNPYSRRMSRGSMGRGRR